MPAVIDTGGPRVLHCVERADCPIPGSQNIVSLSCCSSYSSYPVRVQRESRFAVDVVLQQQQLRCCIDGASSYTETWNIPGNDERNQFFNDESPRSVTTMSSNDLGDLVPPQESRALPSRDRKRYDALQRRLIKRRRCLQHEASTSKQHSHLSQCTRQRHNVCAISEIAMDQELSSSFSPVDEIHRQGTSSTIRSDVESRGNTTTTARDLTPEFRPNGTDVMGQSSDDTAMMRLFGGCDVVQERGTMYRSVVKSSTEAISSQRVSNCAEYEWQCECECINGITNITTINDSEKVIGERERTKRHRTSTERNDIQKNKGRTYVHLAFLLFLVAFGHGSMFKSNSVFGGRNGAIGAGLGALTFGTFVGNVGAMPVDLDAGVRAERSANLSHITGASRKIQMYIKNRHLQILPDGMVNGSNDDTSDYTIFQRTPVSVGQLRIQGVATCLYLCMDSCGLLYGSREYTQDCVFNETLEEHNYNTYSSVRWSTAKKTLYLGLNRRGQPRRVQAKGHNLGRLSAYARVLTQVAAPDRVEQLQARMQGAQHKLRHHHKSHHHRNMQEQQQQPQQTLCPSLPPQEKDGRDKFRCRKRKKRKKLKRRRCNEGEKPGPHCERIHGHEVVAENAEKARNPGESGRPESKRSCEGEASEELCRKQALDAPAKKRKSRIDATKLTTGTKETRPALKHPKRKRKESRTKKPKDFETSGLGVDDNDDSATKRRVKDEPSGGRRKKTATSSDPSSTKNEKKSPMSRKTANISRVSRTTIAAIPSRVTLPTVWYPGVQSTTPSSRQVIASWQQSETSSLPSMNAVTSATPRKNDSNVRNGKSLIVDEQSSEIVTLTDQTETLVDTSRESSIEEGQRSLSSDWSIETSEEAARYDESSMQREDDQPTTSLSSTYEYSTLMTTMDTTSPERTEDYSRSSTQSIIELAKQVVDLEGEKIVNSSTINDQTSGSFSREIRSDYERLAM